MNFIPGKVGVAIGVGRLVRAYLMLHDRIGEADCTLAFEKVCDFNDDDALIVGWQRWTQDLICMRSRLSNAMIELNKRQAEDIAV